MNRQIDEFGRLVIPKDVRVKLGIRPQDKLKIEVNNYKIIIEKENKDNSLNNLIEELKLRKDYNKIDISYIIERLEDIKNGR